MSEPGIVASARDVADLNRAAAARSSAWARLAGTVLVGIGLTGALLWAWFEVRAQRDASSGPLSFNINSASGTDLDLVDRIDLLVTSLSLLLSAALVFGAGLALRAFADYSQARVGASITGFEVGDAIDDTPEFDL